VRPMMKRAVARPLAAVGAPVERQVRPHVGMVQQFTKATPSTLFALKRTGARTEETSFTLKLGNATVTSFADAIST
jgi:hypothetical protein